MKGMQMNKNPLLRLRDLGQSIWLDYIHRNMLSSGELKRLIREDGIKGVTSNPAIFEKAIGHSRDYDSTIQSLSQEQKSSIEIYQVLAVEDVQHAADDFKSVFAETDGRDGFVSLEVSPGLARDTRGTIEEARRLWAAVDRPNIFIKVPGTKEGLPAIQQLISEGINVNVTLLFDLDRYSEVTDAYLSGLEQRAAAGMNVSNVASVASFFLSRIDLLVDPHLEETIKKGGNTGEIAGRLHGETAIASAKIAYEIYRRVFSAERFRKLSQKGARTQRVLWASTSTKNPAFSDVKYVEALIGPDTVNTVPMETLDAYRDHGNPALRLEEHMDKAHETMRLLPEAGIDIKAVTGQLEEEGIEKFSQPFDRLIAAIEEKRLGSVSQIRETKKESFDSMEGLS
jgi:transaldolase